METMGNGFRSKIVFFGLYATAYDQPAHAAPAHPPLLKISLIAPYAISLAAWAWATSHVDPHVS